MKRMAICLSLALALCLGLVSAACATDTAEAAEAKYVASGSCGENLMWKLDEEGTLTITGIGSMSDFSYGITHGEAGSGFMWCTIPWYRSLSENELPWDLSEAYEPMDIRAVIISEGVSSISSLAFLFCDGITEIEIPASVIDISAAAFYGCSSLTDVYYSGNQDQWGSINIADENAELLAANIHFESMKDEKVA